MPRAFRFAVVAAAVFAFAAPSALAGGSPAPAIQQYVEQLPTASGNPPAGGGTSSHPTSSTSSHATASTSSTPPAASTGSTGSSSSSSTSPSATHATATTAIPLAPAVEKKVRHAGAVGKKLRQIATNPALGAPVRAASAATVARPGGGGSGLLILVLIALAALVAGGGAWAATHAARSQHGHTP